MQFIKMKSAVWILAAVAVMMLAATASAQLTEARIPVRVNMAATVLIQPLDGTPGEGAAKVVAANVWDTLDIMIDASTTSILSGGAGRHNAVPASARYRSGNLSVELSPQQYRNATLSLYSVDGRRVLGGKTDISKRAHNISRPNVAPGVYLLSVKSADGNAFTTRLVHKGGRLNINVAFGGGGHSLRKDATASAVGTWRTTAIAAKGYGMATRTFSPITGINEPQDITLALEIAEDGTFIDPRDGSVYRSVTIGNQIWMAENLNYAVGDVGVCYDNNSDNCDTYGRLYTWSEAMAIDPAYNNAKWNGRDTDHQGICPAGWHVPSGADWDILTTEIGSVYTIEGWNGAGTTLKSETGWNSGSGYIAGTDDFGFSALPGGHGNADGSFHSIGDWGMWWSATEHNTTARITWIRMMFSNRAHVSPGQWGKLGAYSVRCVRSEIKKYAVTVVCAGTGATGGGIYNVGETVIINAGTAPAGQVFINWTTSSNGVIFAYNNAATTFIMPGNDVTVTANFGLPSQGSFTDARDGKTYRTVKIGMQTWMAENLNYATAIGSWCYNDADSNCVKYGRLYGWMTAMNGARSSDMNPSDVQGVCPSGWHVPSVAEWTELINYVNTSPTSTNNAGRKLKSASGWSSARNGTDDYGFAALPGGRRSPQGTAFNNIGNHGWWWSSTEDGSIAARYLHISTFSPADSTARINSVSTADSIFEGSKYYGYSVRCVMSETIKPKYAVTIVSAGTGATGGGSYAAGDAVTIFAGTAPAGLQFKNWTASSGGVTFANNAITTFIMPDSDVTLTASFGSATQGSFVDARDNNVYRTVTIGNQEWMAENLNFAVATSWYLCNYANSDTCAMYGRLYNWSEAMGLDPSYNDKIWSGGDRGICPVGWRLPSDADWTALINYVGSSGSGTKLKSATGWNSGGNGTDDYGFSALPGGSIQPSGGVSVLDEIGNRGVWWSSTQQMTGLAWARIMAYNNDYVSTGNAGKANKFSVRCVRDAPMENQYTDIRDNKVYPVVQINNRIWFAKNLDYAGGSDGNIGMCYNNSADSCAKYGRIYTWHEAMNYTSSSDKNPSGVRGVCPSGWHLPSDAEWTGLVNYVNTSPTSTSNAGRRLRSTTWGGTDNYGFAALPGGSYRNTTSSTTRSFYDVGNYAYWWSATETTGLAGDLLGRARYIYGTNENVTNTSSNMANGYSVRCVLD